MQFLNQMRLAMMVSLLSLICSVGEGQQKPLKVFVLVGQSNMQGHAHVRTLPHIGMDPKTKPILEKIQDDQGVPRIQKNVWISFLSSAGVKTGQLTTGFGADENKIGPELTFGIYMHQRLQEPILIIKTAWGGKSLHTDFRPPSAGPFVFEDSVLERLKQQGKNVAEIKAEKVDATGVYYRQTLAHIQGVLADIKVVQPEYDPKQGYELAGMVWFQGWNDMVDQNVYPERSEPGGYDQYSRLLSHLIRDFRKDLEAPNLPFVIGVMGVEGPTQQYSPKKQRYAKVHQYFRDAMAAPANESDLKGNVVTVLTENAWDSELESLIVRDNRLKDELKKLQAEGKIENKNRQAMLETRRTKEFSDQELVTLQTGVSNAAYHYLGCAKIMTQIGKAFAETMPVPEK